MQVSENLFESLAPVRKIETFSREELIDRVGFLESECARAIKEIYRLRNTDLSEAQVRLLLEEPLWQTREALFGSKSERYKKPVRPEDKKPLDPKKPSHKLPSQRYPNIPVREELVTISPAPNCNQCGSQMSDSGMTENSEKLNVIPKKFEIVVTKRSKYRCSCQGCLVTAPAPARIAPGSSYSDEMIVDIALSKYCDLIPVNRYVHMASRQGVKGLPAQSLIETTHVLSEFLSPAYELLKGEILDSKILHADETPHRMLEGSKSKSWYLWGFSTPKASYFECRETRWGDVAGDILKKSKCEILVSDVYSGYGKAVRVTNQVRSQDGQVLIQNAYCNAHARRYFFKSYQSKYKEACFYLDAYHEIYQLYDQLKEKPPPEESADTKEAADIRDETKNKILAYFESMKKMAENQLLQYPAQNQYGKALRYFLENYVGLSLFITTEDVPIDNNPQERQLRSPVIGRKTWYGTHSKLGAKTAAILFSLVESCKLNGVNPREYFPALVKDLLKKSPAFTPRQFSTLN